MAFRLPFRPRTIIIIAGLLASFFVARQGFWVEPDSLIVKEYSLELPAWPVALNGFKVVAIGDLHGGAPYVDEKKLKEMVRRVAASNPDLIVWLGDYVIQGVLGGKFMEPERVAAILSGAKGRYGRFAIGGNHDRWLGTPRVERAFEAAGIPFLRWKSTTLQVKGEVLHIHGLDDFELSPHYWQNLALAKEEWRKLPTSEPLLVLSHSPDVFPAIPARVALTLAAHTHGGQVRLPLFGSLIVPSSYGQRFARGPIEEEGRHLFVNTGIGTSIIPIRLGVPPEISILILSHAAAH